MKKYKHIIWDWNGTLLNDVDCCIKIANELLEKHPGDAMSKDSYREVFGFPIKNYYQQVGFDFQIESFESLCEQFISAYKKALTQCKLHQGAQAVVQQIQKYNISQSVLSAAEDQLLRSMVHRFELSPYFEKLSGLADNQASSKLENGHKLVQELNLSRGEYLLIGDTQHDLEVAQIIGADCLLVANGHQSVTKLKATHHLVLDNLEQVLAFIKV